MTVGEQIRELRGTQPLYKLSGITGTSPATWYRIERGGDCRLAVLARIAEHFGYEVVLCPKSGNNSS